MRPWDSRCGLRPLWGTWSCEWVLYHPSNMLETGALIIVCRFKASEPSGSRYFVQAPANSKAQKTDRLEHDVFPAAAQPRSKRLELAFRIGHADALPRQLSRRPVAPFSPRDDLVLIKDRLPNRVVAPAADDVLEFPDGAGLPQQRSKIVAFPDHHLDR